MVKGATEITTTETSFIGEANGIADQNTLTELDNWINKKFVKPVLNTEQGLPKGNDTKAANIIKVPFYYQLDSKWVDETLGASRTIGQAGCCISSLAMILKFYGRDVDPKSLDKYLDENSGYSGNSVYFDITLKFKEGNENKLTYKGNRLKTNFTSTLDERINNNTPTIGRVKYGSSKSTSGDHFVVIVGKTDGGKYIMNDPGAVDGNGVENPTQSNIIEDTKRKSGYTLIWIDCISVS